MKTPPVTSLAIAAITGSALLFALIGPAGAHPTTHTHELSLTTHQDLGLSVIPCDTCVMNSYGFEPGAHIGEFLINHGTLTDSHDTTVGHYAMQILGTTVATEQPPEVQLIGTLSLPAGQITVQGLEEPPSTGGVLAITGGTGRYADASGTMQFHDIDDTTALLTLNIR